MILAVPAGSATRGGRQPRQRHGLAGHVGRGPAQGGPLPGQRRGGDRACPRRPRCSACCSLLGREEQRQRHVHHAGLRAASSSTTKAAPLSSSVASTRVPDAAQQRRRRRPRPLSARPPDQTRRPSSRRRGRHDERSGGAPAPAARLRCDRPAPPGGGRSSCPSARRRRPAPRGRPRPAPAVRCPGARTGGAVPRSACPRPTGNRCAARCGPSSRIRRRPSPARVDCQVAHLDDALARGRPGRVRQQRLRPARSR